MNSKILVLSTLTLTLLTLLTTVACNKSQVQQQPVSGPSDSNIVNGQKVLETDPYGKHTVGLGKAKKPDCTGVIITKHHILTAAHCAEGIEGGHVTFALDVESPKAEIRKITKITRHEEFCDEPCMSSVELGDTNDLSMVEFEGSLPASYEPVTIAAPEQINSGKTVYLVGFGANEKYQYDNILKVTKVPTETLGASEFKTDERKSGSCNGDSGGPAFIMEKNKLLLAGITSRGDTRCRKLGIYTMPGAHESWILKNTGR